VLLFFHGRFVSAAAALRTFGPFAILAALSMAMTSERLALAVAYVACACLLTALFGVTALCAPCAPVHDLSE